MTMGIDHFRGLAKLDDLENRRVKFQQDENGKWHMLAQDHLWGRLVSWWHRNDPVDPEHYKTIQNNQVRKAFYEALVKAEGKTFADHLIDKVFGENAHQTFQTRGRSLQASRITQVLTLAETEREKNTTRTLRDLQSYQDSGRMGTHTRTYAKALGHDDFRSNDPELRKTLLHLVKSHPDYGRKRFTEDELKELTREATRRCCEAKQKRFEEQYPGLSRLEHAPFHDIDTFFTKMLQDLRGPPVNDQLQPFENLARDALGLIQGTYKVSSDMRFDPAELSGRMAILTDRKAALQQRLENLTSNEIDEALFANDDPETLQARELRAALCIELETQIGKLDAKLAFFGDYLKHDPLSDKAIAYHKLILRQASRQMLEDLAEETALKAMVLPVRNQPGWSTQVEEQRRKFQEQMTALKHAINHADDRIALAKDELEKAGTDRKPMSERNRQIKQDRTDEVNFVSRYFDLIGHSLPFLVTVAKQHDQAQVKVLDTVQEWHVISRDFSTSRDGVDRNYRSVMKPGPKLDGPVGQSYEKDGIKGVSAGNKTEPNHPRNLWVSELYRVEKVTDPETGKVQIDPETGKEMEITVKLSQTIRHGVVDPWNIEDPEKRKEASEAGVEEVLTTAVDINENFKKRALQKKLHPEREDPNTFVNGRPKRNKIVHVNLNLTTADTTLLRKPMRDYREGDFTINQFDAFASYNGTHALKVQVANDNVPPEGEDDQVGGNVGGNGVDGNVNEDGNVNQVGNVDNGVNGPNGNDDLDQMSRIFEDAPRNPPNENNQNGPPQQELIFIDLPNVNPIPLNVLNLQNEVGGNVQQEPLILELPPNVNNPPGNVQVGGNEQPNPLVLNLDDIDNPPNVPPNQGENLNPVPGNLQGNNDNQVGQNLPQNLLNLPDDVDPNAILDIDELLNQGNPNGQVNQDGDVNQGNGVNQNGPVNQVDGGAPGIDEDGNTEIEFDIDTITFSFGVNEVAMGKGFWGVHSDKTLWGLVEAHDRANMIKLVGDLNPGSFPGGYIGEIFDQLKEAAADPNTSPEDKRKLLDLVGQLQREVDTARTMFNSGAYKVGIDDAYKMGRSIMRIVNLGAQGLDVLGDDENLLSLSQGCKSNKDRGGMADVEHKAQVVIEDMGGTVEPSKPLSPQDQVIYNTVLTSSGQDEIQQLNTGLPGSKNAGDLRARINDPEAELTAKAFSKHTNA